MTKGSTYALRRENEIGSLEPGKLAYIVILSENPLTFAPDSIRNIDVLMTMVGGNSEYSAPGYKVYSPN